MAVMIIPTLALEVCVAETPGPLGEGEILAGDADALSGASGGC